MIDDIDLGPELRDEGAGDHLKIEDKGIKNFEEGIVFVDVNANEGEDEDEEDGEITEESMIAMPLVELLKEIHKINNLTFDAALAASFTTNNKNNNEKKTIIKF